MDEVPSTSNSQPPASRSASRCTSQESRRHAQVLTDEVVRNQQALLDAVREIATGIRSINENLNKLLNVLANK